MHEIHTQSRPVPAIAPPDDLRGRLLGIVGLVLVVIASVLSPISFLGLPACVLIPMGFTGLALCIAAVCIRARWPGVVGLIIGLATVAFWTIFFGRGFQQVTSAAAAHGLNVAQHTNLCIAAMNLAEAGETQRLATGQPAPTFSMAAVPLEYQTDPWGKPLRYALVPSPRGFTFLSNGPDGLPSTPDDLDLFTLQSDGTFTLPPITPTPSIPPSRAP